VEGPLKGPQSTTTADTLTHTRFSVLSLILFVNHNVLIKLKYDFVYHILTINRKYKS